MMAMTSSDFADGVASLRDSTEAMQARLTPLFTRAFGSEVAADHHRIMTPLWIACLRYLADGTIENRRVLRTAFTDAAMTYARAEGTD